MVALAAILANGSVVTWPRFDCGDSTGVQDQLRNVRHVCGTKRSFAASLADRSVVTWGDPNTGGDSTAVQDRLRNVQQVGLTFRAFAAILADGSVVTWGKLNFGGDSTAEHDRLCKEIGHSADGGLASWGALNFASDSSGVQGAVGMIINRSPMVFHDGTTWDSGPPNKLGLVDFLYREIFNIFNHLVHWNEKHPSFFSNLAWGWTRWNFQQADSTDGKKHVMSHVLLVTLAQQMLPWWKQQSSRHHGLFMFVSLQFRTQDISRFATPTQVTDRTSRKKLSLQLMNWTIHPKFDSGRFTHQKWRKPAESFHREFSITHRKPAMAAPMEAMEDGEADQVWSEGCFVLDVYVSHCTLWWTNIAMENGHL